jgi:CxxH/CxxC protein (TIGR04129 family)
MDTPLDNKNIIYSCAEHIDIMIEEWVNEYELAPEIDLVDDKKKAPCSWCKQDAVYYIIPLEIEIQDDHSPI